MALLVTKYNTNTNTLWLVKHSARTHSTVDRQHSGAGMALPCAAHDRESAPPLGSIDHRAAPPITHRSSN